MRQILKVDVIKLEAAAVPKTHCNCQPEAEYFQCFMFNTATTRKRCSRKETVRCRKCSFWF